MKQVFKFDSNGFYVEPVILYNTDTCPSNCTEKQPQDGLFKAKFINGSWIEGLTSTEIATLKAKKDPLQGFEKLKKDYTDLVFTLMSKGVI